MGWRTTMRKAKEKHRPELDDWEEDGLFEVFPAFVNGLSEDYEVFIPSQQGDSSSEEQLNRGHPPPINEEIPAMLDAKTLTPQQFATDYEAKKIPAVISNIPHGFDGGKQTEEWGAMRNWGFFTLENDPDLRDRPFKCGEDDDGCSIKIKLKHFLKYLQSNHDDSPLYIFDSAFDDDKIAKKILRDYRVPSYFKEDLFRLCSESRRPPYRWFLVGPERSGTCVHIDPLATSAWNTLIHGQKRWVLFPPHVPKKVVKGRDLVRDDEDDEPIHYFMYILPRIKRKAAAAAFCGGEQQQNGDYKDFACYEFTQQPGETVFIPNGWWHAVLNLTHTVGITQNYCSGRNFDEVWMQTRSGRKRLAWKWLGELEQRYPRLADRAKALNARDKFVMKYDPAVQKMRQDWEARLEAQKRQRQHPRGGEKEEEEKKEANGVKNDSSSPEQQPAPVPTNAVAKPVIDGGRLPSSPYIPSSQIAHLDRGWKRIRITEEAEEGEEKQHQQPRRTVSPPVEGESNNPVAASPALVHPVSAA